VKRPNKSTAWFAMTMAMTTSACQLELQDCATTLGGTVPTINSRMNGSETKTCRTKMWFLEMIDPMTMLTTP
jgi:hypothetical protein